MFPFAPPTLTLLKTASVDMGREFFSRARRHLSHLIVTRLGVIKNVPRIFFAPRSFTCRYESTHAIVKFRRKIERKRAREEKEQEGKA